MRLKRPAEQALARIPQRAIDPIPAPIHNENVRERTSRRHATIAAGLLLGAVVLALLTAERGPAALPGEQSSLSVGHLLVTEGTGGVASAVFSVRTTLVGAPHDSRKRWVDSGAVFDSFTL
jgi:hypothetical protein